jgi:hypothetical protein
MRVIANHQLRGEYTTEPGVKVTVLPDQPFEPSDEAAEQLLKAGLVRHARPPKVQYETKVIVPEAPEVGPREPFRDVPVPHAQSQDVATEGAELFHGADLSPLRAPHPRGRGGRAGSRPSR